MSGLALRRSQRQTAQDGYLPPPSGGLNTTDPAGAMSATDAVALNNLIPSEMGIRARLGQAEWCTNLDGIVYTIIPFNGANPANDKLFATTATGIWDCAASSAAPSKVFSFSITSGSAGIGSFFTMVTSAGHFLMYCDEENGYHLYGETLGTWQKVVSATQTAWVTLTAYVIGNLRSNDSGKIYICTQSGTSGATGPTGTGTNITDGTCKWNFNQSVSGVDPANFVQVTCWKNRAWFTQKATSLAWYLGLNSIAGAATSFNFGGQFKVGGPLRGLWNWTLDAGIGMDDNLVAISGAGDVVVYSGSDPSSANTFGLNGVWTVGALPVGRNIATTFGGDILIASLVGIVPLSKLVLGNVSFDRSQYLTQKVQNLFNYYTGLYGSNFGWSLQLDPKDNALLVLVPVVAGQPTTQLAMSLATRGWFPYTGLAMNCAAPWNGVLYFGTITGTVAKHDGYVDGVTLANPNGSVDIQWSCISSFQNLGTPKLKRCHLIRVKVVSQGGGVPLQAQARFDFDLTSLAPTAGAIANQQGWDHGIWDVAVWGGDYASNQTIFGATGTGSHMAVAVAGLANTRTIFAGVDVSFGTGGFL